MKLNKKLLTSINQLQKEMEQYLNVHYVSHDKSEVNKIYSLIEELESFKVKMNPDRDDDPSGYGGVL